MLHVIGGGLAGAEAAWQAAQRGLNVTLWEMRPEKTTPAHFTDQLAELVCSNSLGSDRPDRAGGVLKAELRYLDSLIMACADESALPAGGALAVGREKFAAMVTQKIVSHPRITLIREEVCEIPDEPAIVATGPLTSNALSESISRLIGEDYLYFYDALAPIVKADSVNMNIAFRQSRYDRGQTDEGDYINCPLDAQQYRALVEELITAEKIELRDFEREDPNFFEGCLPVEEIARRGSDSLAFGPLRPVGLTDPRTGKRPFAVVQLRQDNLAGTLYNLVGFQTNLRWVEQQRILKMIPGLEDAEFIRLGQMHRNTFINAPALLEPTMQYVERKDLFFAGQITGIEGYVGNAGSGLLAGVNAANLLNNQPLWTLPKESILGSLAHYVAYAEERHFQPMKANFGLMPPLDPPVRNKQKRYQAYGQRALEALAGYVVQAVG